MSVEALSGKVFLLITGASRGIGRQIAITFSSLLEEGSHVLLLARSKDALQEVASSISFKVKIHTVSTDLSKSTELEFKEFISEALKGTTTNAFNRVVLVHNVGIIGDVFRSVNNILDANIWKEFYDINFFVPVVLNTVVMNMFDKTTKKMIINITSLAAIQPFFNLGPYCSVKAAKEMYFKVFALENPDVDVLNYSPGPVDTDMYKTVCKILVDPQTKKKFTDAITNKTLLTTEQTVNRLVQVVQEHNYNSADHVDYYDKL